MNLILELVRNPAASLLGEVLLHFLWQGTAVAALLALALMLLRDAKANVRYTLACVALASMVALPLATGLLLSQGGGFTEGSPVATVFGGALPPANQAPSAAVESELLPWRGWLMIAWLAGVAGFGLRLAGGWLQTQRLRRRDVTPLGEPWTGRLSSLARRLGVSRPVQLLESARVTAPLVLGWLKPVILVPVGFVSSLSPSEVDAILAHEVAHLRRHDYLVNLAQRLVEALLFYHPAVWWVSERIRIERENCCDDFAASAVGGGRVVAQALVALAERSVGIPSLALAADGGVLGDRVRRLLGVKAEGGTTRIGPTLFWVVSLLLLVLAGIWVMPQLLAPKLYVATARLRLDAPLAVSEGGKPAPYDPYYLQTEFEVIRSRSTLGAVVERLGLAQSWATKGATLSKQDAVQRLQERLLVSGYRSTSLAEVKVAAEQPKEAAEIANCVVAIYFQQRQDRYTSRAMERFRMLRQEAEERERRVNELRDNLRARRADKSPSASALDMIAATEREMELSQKAYETVVTQMRESDLASKSPLQDAMVIDRAEPPMKAQRWRPVRD